MDSAQDFRAEWARLLADAMQAKGLGRTELATELGVSRAAVGYWLRGEIAPRPPLQVRIAQLLEVEPRDLFPLEGAA